MGSGRRPPRRRRTPSRAGILPPLPALVLGQSEALRAIKARLRPDGATPDRPPGQRLTVVRGWPGVGKSTLAACLAHDEELAARFPDGVLWAALGPHPAVRGELAAWGRALALDGLARLAEVAAISRHLARHLADRRMLLIVDDVWEERDAIPFMVGGGAARCCSLPACRGWRRRCARLSARPCRRASALPMTVR